MTHKKLPSSDLIAALNIEVTRHRAEEESKLALKLEKTENAITEARGMLKQSEDTALKLEEKLEQELCQTTETLWFDKVVSVPDTSDDSNLYTGS